MVKKTVVVTAKTGLHARPANMLLKKARQYESEVEISVGGERFNAKSLLSILSAGAENGKEIEVICTGPDEESACEAIVDLVAHGMLDE